MPLTSNLGRPAQGLAQSVLREGRIERPRSPADSWPLCCPQGSPELAPPLSSHSALIQAPAGPQEGVENVGGPGSAASLGAGDRGFGAGNATAGWLLWAEPLLMLRLS